MSSSVKQRRVLILANPDKPHVVPALDQITSFARARTTVTGACGSLDVELALREPPDRLIILGGDGTLIGVARALGLRQAPLIGVNMGKLGFLAEFSLQELCDQFETVIGDDACISRRMMLEVTLLLSGLGERTLQAVNDCVIQMGPPFRMIALNVAIDGEQLTHIRGDGVAVCTPSGSTAHSLSAGGPVMAAQMQAIGLTPLNPHSLTHRPIVLGPESVIEIRPETVNSGSSVILDGQVTHPLREGDVIRIRRSQAQFQLVRNPRHSAWHNLVTKLHWGQPPST